MFVKYDKRGNMKLSKKQKKLFVKLKENDIANNYKDLIFDVYKEEYREWFTKTIGNWSKLKENVYHNYIGRAFLEDFLNPECYEYSLTIDFKETYAEVFKGVN